jgi:Dyp-type peroxidase family
LILAADHEQLLDQRFGELIRAAPASGLKLRFHEIGDNRGLDGREHFGWKDGISQPGVRGRLSSPGHEPITPREVDLARSHRSYADPHAPEYARPGQMLVWPGEFVLGYPRQSAVHPRAPAAGHPVAPGWSQNGSFLVYLRLRQHVERFERALAEAAAARGVSVEAMAARMMGRARDGRPLSHPPGMDEHENHFAYADAAEPLAHGEQVTGRVPADPLGERCPFSAHIRKLNPRDDTTEEGGVAGGLRRRVLRRGIPYRYGDDRGLLFVSYQASIEEQFEKLVAGWAMGAARPAGPGGPDAILGRLGEPEHFVELLGGGYFFAPAISTVRRLARG